MRYIWLLTISLLALNTSGQHIARALRSDISVSKVMLIKNNAVRIVYDASSHTFYYNTANGDIYKIHENSDGTGSDELMYTSNDHGIEYLMGMICKNGILYLTGNNNPWQPYTTGLIVKGISDVSGKHTWSIVAQTEPYQTSGTYDHMMSGITVTPNGDTVIVSNGARGDHGEVSTRNGQFPGLRNPPLTSILLCVPSSANGLILKNDSQWLASNGYVFARGVRNFFDMGYCANGELFALENSCDRDHNEEMNWLHRGQHYGYPWKFGSTWTPVTRKDYNPDKDLLWPIDAWSRNFHGYYYDSLFPPPPPGEVFADPIFNIGPDADKFKDTLTGLVIDASDNGIPLQTFTAHRSPLGLVFDNDSMLAEEFKGHAFMLSYNRGLDSANSLPPNHRAGPFLDPSEDLVHLHLMYDPSLHNYKLSATRIVEQFNGPVDAEIVGNSIYVLENQSSADAFLWKVQMPLNAMYLPSHSFDATVYPNPATDFLDMKVQMKDAAVLDLYLTNLQGQVMVHRTVNDLHAGLNTLHIPVQVPQGLYVLRLESEGISLFKKLMFY